MTEKPTSGTAAPDEEGCKIKQQSEATGARGEGDGGESGGTGSTFKPTLWGPVPTDSAGALPLSKSQQKKLAKQEVFEVREGPATTVRCLGN